MIHKQDIRWEKVYLLGTILQMAVICGIVEILRINNIQYPDIINLVFLALGGTSSAMWGIIVSKKSGRINSYKQILRDFFYMRVSIKLYGLMILFLMILFGTQILSGRLVSGVKWYTFILLFGQAIIFGGIEEIGWRYTFQPILEKNMSFELASLITFVSWGTWHYMYFYITDSLTQIDHSTFLIGLLGSCFIIGALYKVSYSLWLCVMYHCLLNVLSQTTLPNSLGKVILYNGIGIILAIVISRNRIFKN